MNDNKPDNKQIRAYLMTLSKHKLISELLIKASNDPMFHNELASETALSSKKRNDLSVIKSVIATAVDPGDFVDYHQTYAYAAGVERALIKVDDVIKNGNAQDALELVEFALEKVNNACNHVDDSASGCMGDFLSVIEEMYYQACLKLQPDPIKLARRLFDLSMENFIGSFDDAAEKYAELLGKDGLSEYRKIVEKEYERIKDKDDRYDHGALRIESLMEKLLKSAKDTEGLVAFKSRKLKYPYNYLEIAEIYRDAGNQQKAIEWAENGLKKFPDRPDNRVREFLADEYLKQGRKDEAMGLIWVSFAEAPGPGCYKALKAYAEGMGRWKEMHATAMAHMVKFADQEKKEIEQKKHGYPRFNSALVEILLLENKADEAWKEAINRPCFDGVWYKLAEKRKKEHPLDAVFAYKKLVPGFIDHKTKRAYRDAADYIGMIRDLLVKNGKENEFKAYLEEIKKQNKAKRSFIEILDRKKWG